MPEGMPARALTYAFYAETYGFTEKQVNEDISLEMFEWYPKIAEAKARAAPILQKQAQRNSKRERGGSIPF